MAAHMDFPDTCERHGLTITLFLTKEKDPLGCVPRVLHLPQLHPEGGGAREARISPDDRVDLWIALGHARASLTGWVSADSSAETHPVCPQVSVGHKPTGSGSSKARWLQCAGSHDRRTDAHLRHSGRTCDSGSAVIPGRIRPGTRTGTLQPRRRPCRTRAREALQALVSPP